MTMHFISTANCVICGEECHNPVLASTNAFGTPDLDLRPPPMQRHTMGTWVQCCRDCGFVAADIEQNPYSVDQSTIQALLQRPDYPPMGQPDGTWQLGNFERQALLEQWAGSRAAEADAWRHAAWCADDGALYALESAADPALYLGMAQRFRRETIRATLAMLAVPTADFGDEQQFHARVRLVDALRRVGDFNATAALCDELFATGGEAVLGPAAVIGHILTFQRAKAQAHDIACYRISDAMLGLPDA